MTETTEGLWADLREPLVALYAALSAAQAAFPPIPRDRTVRVRTRTGDTYEFSYAPLDTILEKVRPVLGSNGLAVTQTFRAGNLVTSLLHAAGGRIESELPLERDGLGWQEFGSAITYARRYAIVAMLGVASEEDDDGNSAEGGTAQETQPKRAGRGKASDKQVALIHALLRELVGHGDTTIDELKAFMHAEYGVEHTSELTGGKDGTASQVITRLQQRVAELEAEDIPWPDAEPPSPSEFEPA